ncbi:hypothetical protein Tco_0800567 [Tanacetum coccineum]|uniref:Uncharacterized protein n=1 Tax=Tanacetum coccineum TaxID=301880 RepID=A0ABQ4ZTH1_9ASTR
MYVPPRANNRRYDNRRYVSNHLSLDALTKRSKEILATELQLQIPPCPPMLDMVLESRKLSHSPGKEGMQGEGSRETTMVKLESGTTPPFFIVHKTVSNKEVGRIWLCHSPRSRRSPVHLVSFHRQFLQIPLSSLSLASCQSPGSWLLRLFALHVGPIVSGKSHSYSLEAIIMNSSERHLETPHKNIPVQSTLQVPFHQLKVGPACSSGTDVSMHDQEKLSPFRFFQNILYGSRLCCLVVVSLGAWVSDAVILS